MNTLFTYYLKRCGFKNKLRALLLTGLFLTTMTFSGRATIHTVASATDWDNLCASDGAVLADGDTIEVSQNITIAQGLRWYSKNITIRGINAGITITAEAGFPKKAEFVDSVSRWYNPSMIEVGGDDSLKIPTSVTLENIILDDNFRADADNNTDAGRHQSPTGRYDGIISSYAASGTITLKAGTELKNSGGNGVVFVENCYLLIEDGVQFSNWHAPSGTSNPETQSATAIYMMSATCDLYADITNNTVAGGGIAWLDYGSTLNVKSTADISNNNFSTITGTWGGMFWIWDRSKVNIEGRINSNKTGGILRSTGGSAQKDETFHLYSGAEMSKNTVSGNLVTLAAGNTFYLDSGAVIKDNIGSTSAGMYAAMHSNNDAVWEIAGEISGNTSNVTYRGAPNATLNIRASGKFNNNQCTGTSNIYAANLGANFINVWGQINDNKAAKTNAAYSGRGAVVYQQKGEFNIYDGAQINNNIGGPSGGIICLNGAGGAEEVLLNMYGGEIKNNQCSPTGNMVMPDRFYADYTGHTTPGGGAVQISKGSRMIMYGGEISGNSAVIAGGILVCGAEDGNKSPLLIIKGGTIQNNAAMSIGNTTYKNSFGKDIAILAPLDNAPNNLKRGSGYLGDYGDHYVEISPEAVIGEGFVGIQNRVEPSWTINGIPIMGGKHISVSWAWNQAVYIPSTRTETLAIGTLKQWGDAAATALLDSLKAAVTDTVAGYAAGLSKYDAQHLMYDGAVWINSDKTSGVQKISMNYPTGYTSGAHQVVGAWKAIAAADRNKYEYVVSCVPVDTLCQPIANAKPSIIIPESSANTLDVEIPVNSLAHGYGIVKYYYPKTSEMTLHIAHEGDGVFVENISNNDSPKVFTYDSTTSMSTPLFYTLTATPTSPQILAQITLTAGDSTITAMTPNVNGEVSVGYNDLAVGTNTIKAYFMPRSDTTYVADTACAGMEYNDNGFHIANPESGVYYDTLQAAAGHDSIVVLALALHDAPTIRILEDTVLIDDSLHFVATGTPGYTYIYYMTRAYDDLTGSTILRNTQPGDTCTVNALLEGWFEFELIKLTDANGCTATGIKDTVVVMKRPFAVAIDSLAPLVYNGKPQTPILTIKDTVRHTFLALNYDYEVTYSNNTDAGTATAAITGKGKYAGTATAAFLIEKAPLHAAANDSTIVYGNALPASYRISYRGFVNSEDTTVLDAKPTAASTAAANAGAYEITVTGGADNNYAYRYHSGTLTITKAPLTVKAADTARVYGSNNPAFRLIYTGFVSGDNESAIDAPPAATSDASPVHTPGTYAIAVKEGNDNNYMFTYDNSGVLTVTKAPLTVAADALTKTYGEPNPEFTLTYTGFVNDDNRYILKTEPKAATAANDTSHVGEYEITVSGGASSYYDFDVHSGTLTVTPKDLSSGGINVAPVGPFTYTGNPFTPPLTVTYKNRSLRHGIDYTVTYADNVNAGTATFTIAGTGNYSGTLDGTFLILKTSGSFVPLTIRVEYVEGMLIKDVPIPAEYEWLIPETPIAPLEALQIFPAIHTDTSATSEGKIALDVWINARLKDLEINLGDNDGSFTPAFNPDTMQYEMLLPCSNIFKVTKITPSSGGTVKYLLNGEETAVPAILDKPGSFTFVIHSTGADGKKTESYTIRVTVRYPSYILRQYWNDVLAINLNSATNGGYEFSKYEWFKNGEKLTGEDNKPYLYAPADGTYVVYLTRVGEATPIAACPFVYDGKPHANPLTVYPNPASATATVVNPYWETVKTMELYDELGGLVRQYPCTSERTVLNLSELPTGWYVLRAGKQSTNIIINK
ncbi:MAG: T9SS type A sorting domain-containing protein [Prevotellaceae bacterium]|nr:T9SS type A sorting domain-containing protein [Prevotellaceae bacterium]